MSIITKPFTLSVKAGTMGMTKKGVKLILDDIKDQYQREVAAWADVFCPKESRELSRNLKASTEKAFYTDTELEQMIVLFLDSTMPYSAIIESLTPPINWTNTMSEYQFFSTLVTELSNNSIPRMIRTAEARASARTRRL